MIPSLKNISPIPNISANPAINFPLWIVLPIMAFYLTKDYLKTAEQMAVEARRLTADKREIKNFRKLPSATSFIRIPLAEIRGLAERETYVF